MNCNSLCRIALILLCSCFVIHVSAQTATPWNPGGNAISNGQFLGTTNNEPLIMKTNGVEHLRIKTNGNIQINAFQNMGRGLVYANNNGVLNFTAFPNDTNQVFAGSGNFKSIAALSGWTRTGNVLYNAPGVNVGVGTSNPQYALEVVGSAFFHGTISAQGVILTNKLMADTMKAGSMFTLNNSMHMSAGPISQIYTSNGELRFQSNTGNSYNTIFSAGTNGRVGIGTFNPAYKLDVAGTVRFQNDVYVSRLRPLPGDSVVSIGDSSVVISSSGGYNKIRPSSRGLGIGSTTVFADGANSVAIGQKLEIPLAANNAIIIGTGVIGGNGKLVNGTANSLMIGFNSDLPTMFFAPAAGAGTYGKVGVATTSPEVLFQVNSGTNRITIDKPATNSTGFVSTVGFNVSYDAASNHYVTRGDGQQNSGSAITQDNEGCLRFYVFGNTGGADQSVDLAHFESQSIMTIRSQRVQIGQSDLLANSIFNDPNTKFTVDGRIMCKDLVVSVIDWQDEVFDSSYVLMPLDSVAAYIARYNHLPGVKAESEIESNGMSVSEAAATQQQKIEELMLYILQLDARIKLLEAENKELKEEQPK